MTVHWITSSTGQRESAVLACKRILGKHSYDVLAENISAILKEFAIHNKCCGITTDNGSNFVKCFR